MGPTITHLNTPFPEVQSMKKAILLCGMLLAITASAASAAGVNFAWNNCYGDGGVSNANFACNTNSGSGLAVGSYVTPAAGVNGVTGIEVVVDLATASPTLPAWWQLFNVGACRQTALSINAIINPLDVVCQDYWAGQATPGIAAYQVGLYGPNTARIKAAVAIPAGTQSAVAGNTEYFAFNLGLSHAKTVGTGACAGCNIAACLVLNTIKVATPVAADDVKLSGGGTAPGSDAITWQGGAGVSSTLGTSCPSATPTQNKTWGQIKSLYR